MVRGEAGPPAACILGQTEAFCCTRAVFRLPQRPGTQRRLATSVTETDSSLSEPPASHRGACTGGIRRTRGQARPGEVVPKQLGPFPGPAPPCLAWRDAPFRSRRRQGAESVTA